MLLSCLHRLLCRTVPKTLDIGEKLPAKAAMIERSHASLPHRSGRLLVFCLDCQLGASLARRLRFWAVAARRNSSVSPDNPRSLRRVNFCQRLRWANSISTFLRLRLAS